MSSRILAVVGARPNFVKMAPLLEQLDSREGFEVRILHTGQHYDRALSDGLIERLRMRRPDANLGVGSGSHAEQTAGVMVGVEAELRSDPVDCTIVAGDVNSTLGAALASAKEQVPVAHVESGLRSRDWTMPEELNRVVTDRVSDLLFCTSADAVHNLAAEGIHEGVELVGNTMIDSLHRILEGADRRGVLAAHGLEPRGFALVTLHRPAVVEDPETLRATVDALSRVAERLPVVFPAHPRTLSRLEGAGLETTERLRLTDAMDYLDFLVLESEARLVLTDSGGVQEETSVLGVPCLTYRDNTERPVTVDLGTNRLLGVDPEALEGACMALLDQPFPQSAPEIPLWDGAAGPRAADALLAFLERRTERRATP